MFYKDNLGTLFKEHTAYIEPSKKVWFLSYLSNVFGLQNFSQQGQASQSPFPIHSQHTADGGLSWHLTSLSQETGSQAPSNTGSSWAPLSRSLLNPRIFSLLLLAVFGRFGAGGCSQQGVNKGKWEGQQSQGGEQQPPE